MSRILTLAFLIFLMSCSDEPNFLQLGIKSFKIQNYSLAKNQLRMIQPSDTSYQLAQRYLKKIDSIQNLHSLLVYEKDSIKGIEIERQIKKHLGNYKVDVSGASMDKSVEVYSLNEGGKSVWIWVDYVGGNPVIDDRKEGTWWIDSKGNITIRIQGNSGPIEEIFSNTHGRFIESTRKKRSLVRTQESFNP